MQPFNIKVNAVGKEITLTILPQDDEYKIIYFGGIIGGLKQEKDTLNFIKPEDVVPSSLPLYQHKQAESTVVEEELALTDDMLQSIKNKVELALK